jgi:MFS family permease
MLRASAATAGIVIAVTPAHAAGRSEPDPTDSAKAWLRLSVAGLLSTIGGVGMWSVVVALPAIQAEFGVARADASLPFTFAMLGFAAGGVVMGRLADRFGIAVPLALGTLALSLGYVAVGHASTLWQVAIAHGLLIGFGCSVTFGPLIADMSHWFVRRRGIAVALAASGNYLAGTFWPPVVQHFIATSGWRATHIGIGLFLLVSMLPLTYLLRRRMQAHHTEAAGQSAARRQAGLPFSAATLQVLLCIAGIACCVAMSMPQVHIVAYCGDLGYGAARGAEMLSMMLGFGIVSRVASGFIADRIGGVRTLLLGSVLQGTALFLYLFFDGLTSLYVISALFGLFQGGIVPSYAIIVREYFPPREAGTRLGLVLMATLVGMALGGWMSGAIFDFSGSYQAAFLNGLGWNLLNVSIAAWLLRRSRGRPLLARA